MVAGAVSNGESDCGGDTSITVDRVGDLVHSCALVGRMFVSVEQSLPQEQVEVV